MENWTKMGQNFRKTLKDTCERFSYKVGSVGC